MSEIELEALAPKSDPNQQNGEGEDDEDEEERDVWDSRTEFFLTSIGWSIGISSMWQFPYLLYSGGLGFLLMYAVLTVLIGMPMYYMQLSLGQATGKGPVGAWDIFPLGRGVGIAKGLYGFADLISFVVTMAYSVHYIFGCFTGILPWSVCPEIDKITKLSSCQENCTKWRSGSFDSWPNSNKNCSTPSEMYWSSSVLGIDDITLTKLDDETHEWNTHEALTAFGDIGGVQWDLALYFLISLIIAFLCIFKGIKSSGKVIYFIVPTIYGILAIFFILSCTLEGVSESYNYYQIFNVERIGDSHSWSNALYGIFFSHRAGVVTMLGSHNKPKDKISKCRSAIIIPIIRLITLIIFSITIINFTTFAAFTYKVSVHEVMALGNKLGFVQMPQILSLLPVPQLWSVLFFILVFLIILCQSFLLLQTVLSCIYDGIPRIRKYSFLVTLGLCFTVCLLGIPFLTNAGYGLYVLLAIHISDAFHIIAILEMLFILGIFLRPLLCGSRSTEKSFLDFLVPEKMGIKIVWSFLTGFILLIFILHCVFTFYNSSFEYSFFHEGSKHIGFSLWSKLLVIFLISIPIACIAPFWAYISTMCFIISPKKSWLDLVWPKHRQKKLVSETPTIEINSTLTKMQTKSTKPVLVDCPSCQENGVLTVTESEPTVVAYAWGYCLLTYCLPCCCLSCLPLCLFRKTRHRCPNCQVVIGQHP